MRTTHSVWCNFSQKFFRHVLFHNSVPTEDMRRPCSVWCNISRKKSYIPVVPPSSVFTEDVRTPYSLWYIFSQSLFLDLFSFLIQYLQQTCDGHSQCKANFLKIIFYRPVLFLNSILTEDMRRPYLVWCNNSKKESYIPVVSPTSVFTEDMQTPNSLWCIFSQITFSELFYLFFRGHANNTLSVMHFSQKYFL